MPATATIIRTTYSSADAITPAMFNDQSCLSASVPDATSGTEGVVRLTGDLTGTAGNPQLTETGADAGTYGNTNDNVAQLTIDAKGRVTHATSRPLVLPATGVTAGTYALDALNIPAIVVDTKGRILAAANRNLSTLILDHVRQALYPIGEILITRRDGNPSTWLGFGTWVRHAEGKVLLGLDPLQSPLLATIDNTGGAATHSLTEANLPAHTHTIPELSGSTSSDGAHSHLNGIGDTASTLFVYGGSATGVPGSATDNAAANSSAPTVQGTTSPAVAHTHTVATTAGTTGSVGTADPVNHLPPYVVVAFWKRLA